MGEDSTYMVNMSLLKGHFLLGVMRGLVQRGNLVIGDLSA